MWQLSDGHASSAMFGRTGIHGRLAHMADWHTWKTDTHGRTGMSIAELPDLVQLPIAPQSSQIQSKLTQPHSLTASQPSWQGRQPCPLRLSSQGLPSFGSASKVGPLSRLNPPPPHRPRCRPPPPHRPRCCPPPPHRHRCCSRCPGDACTRTHKLNPLLQRAGPPRLATSKCRCQGTHRRT